MNFFVAKIHHFAMKKNPKQHDQGNILEILFLKSPHFLG
jgi:hypothetical protein